MSETSTNRQSVVGLVGPVLALAALACVCGPLGRVQSTVTRTRNTAGTAQAIGTNVGGAFATGEAAATAVGDLQQSVATDVAPLPPTIIAGLEELNPTLAASDLEEARQWGITAMASSQRDTPAYAATQATGVPNTSFCGDATTAWASATPNSQSEELTITFAAPVIPMQINIYESFNPGFVTQVRLVDVYGDTPVVYQAAPQLVLECPRVLTIDVPPGATPQQVSTIIITLDQSTAPSWAQIDAVELVGLR